MIISFSVLLHRVSSSYESFFHAFEGMCSVGKLASQPTSHLRPVRAVWGLWGSILISVELSYMPGSRHFWRALVVLSILLRFYSRHDALMACIATSLPSCSEAECCFLRPWLICKG